MLSVTLASWLLVALTRARRSDLSPKECQLHDVTSMLQISRIVAGGEDRVIGDTSREDDTFTSSLAEAISGAIADEIRGASTVLESSSTDAAQPVAASLAKPADVSLQDSGAVAAVLATTTNPVVSDMTTSNSVSGATTTWEGETNEQAGMFNGMTLPPDEGCLGPDMTSNTPWQPCEPTTTPNPAKLCATTADCLNGYYCLNEFCEANSCSCENGVAATGAECAMNLAAICASCHGGYTLNNNVCEAHCTCNHGVPATGAACTTNNGAICASCDEGYTLHGDECQAQTCTCDHGEAATDAACTTKLSVDNNGAICASCDEGYTLHGDACEAEAPDTTPAPDTSSSTTPTVVYDPTNVFLLRIRTSKVAGCDTDAIVKGLVDDREGPDVTTDVTVESEHAASTGWQNLQGVDPSHDTFELGQLDEFTVPVVSGTKFVPKRICFMTSGDWCTAKSKPAVSVYDAMKAKGKSGMFGTASGFDKFTRDPAPQCEPIVPHQENEADIDEG